MTPSFLSERGWWCPTYEMPKYHPPPAIIADGTFARWVAEEKLTQAEPDRWADDGGRT